MSLGKKIEVAEEIVWGYVMRSGGGDAESG
jgi:hypothetical protein